jgi:DNA-binding response OmpR family regulator
MRIIVAEDDHIIREVICELLQERGMEVAAAATLDAASRLMRTDRWDVLLTDLLFPGPRTGLDLVGQASACGIRVVIMSGAGDRREQIEAAGLLFLAKPFSHAELLMAVAPVQAVTCGVFSSPRRHISLCGGATR